MTFPVKCKNTTIANFESYIFAFDYVEWISTQIRDTEFTLTNGIGHDCKFINGRIQ